MVAERCVCARACVWTFAVPGSSTPSEEDRGGVWRREYQTSDKQPASQPASCNN